MPVLACIETEKLADPEAVAIGDEDHGGIALAPTVGLGRVHQLDDLALGQVLPRPIGGVWLPRRHNCSFFSGWSYQLEA